MNRSVRGLVLACHPAPTLVVTVITVALSTNLGHSVGRTTLIGLAVLFGQLSIGWSNDWLDARRDASAGRNEKPTVAGSVSAKTLKFCALGALAPCVAFSLANGFAATAAHSVLVVSGWAYNAGLKPTVWSWLPYATGFGALPAFVTLSGPDGYWPKWWLVATGSLLGVGAHLANALPDLEADRLVGVRGLPQRLGLQASAWCSFACLIGASTLAVTGGGFLGGDGSNAASWTMLGLVVAVSIVGVVSARSIATAHRAFACAMAVAVLVAVVFVLGS